jgi:DNA-binding transcriptional regulator YiaG
MPPDLSLAASEVVERSDSLEGLLAPLVEASIRPAVLDRLRAAQETGTDVRWPPDVAPKDVSDWLSAHAPDAAAAAQIRTGIAAMVEAWAKLATDDTVGARAVVLGAGDGAELAQACALAARAFRAYRAMQADLRRPALAVDASVTHHDLVCGYRDLPKDRKPRKARVLDGRIEILAPGGSSVQLLFPLETGSGLHQATIETLRQWRGWEGVRHWAALQRLFSVEGGRSGSVRWKLETHLDALGYAERARRDPAVRRRIAAEVELLTKLELAVYAPDGRLRARQPLLAVGTKYDALQGSEWALEGMELRVNEWLYSGVRDPKTGKLGSDWYPAPIDLAQIDHARFPYAIVLGLILPIRWRWDLGTRDCCTLKGASLLALAGIQRSRHNPHRAWNTLRCNLDELMRRGGLERYEWSEEAWSLEASCRLYPPQWARDRTMHRLIPSELPAPPPIMTGTELRKWRDKKGWSQTETAKSLGVSERTIRLAESKPDNPLGRAILKALSNRFTL